MTSNDTATDGMYHFVQCDECFKHLPVGAKWENTDIECGNCGNIQTVKDTERSENDE